MTESLHEAIAKINPGERVTLTEEERDALAKDFSTFWAEGLCEEDAEFVQTDPESVAVALDYADRLGPVVERILAARAQALREEIERLRLERGEWMARYEALREEIAGEIEEENGSIGVSEDPYGGEYDRGVHEGLTNAARITRGGAR